MTIANVISNARKKEFEVQTTEREFSFPFAKLRLIPSKEDPIVEVYPDDELGREAFTYRLSSGAEDTVHLDAVLEVNMDPDYLRDLMLHKLTIEAKKGLKASDLGTRQIARQLGTSPAQVYRLLDPENRGKSFGQLLYLLYMVDRKVDLIVSPKDTALKLQNPVFQVFCDKAGSFRFRLKQADGGVALLSSTYSTKHSCINAIRKVRNYSSSESSFQKERTERGKYLFRIIAGNHHVIAHSPAFGSASKRDTALSVVKKEAQILPLEELCY